MAELAALAAALCWAIGSLFASDATRQMGGVAFTRVRLALVIVMLLAFAYWFPPNPIPRSLWTSLALSGVIGIFVGDTALFVAMGRLGPRRTSILFATNAPMTAALSWYFLQEELSVRSVIGCLLVSLGVYIAIIYGKRREQLHQWEQVQGHIAVGVAIGLLSALGQSIGSILAKPALDSGLDPVTVATVRIAIALLAFLVLHLVRPSWSKSRVKITRGLFFRLLMSGLFGMALGMTFLLYAFSEGNVGLSAILSSTTPVLLIPALWYISKERPAAGAWLGALITIAGTALILS